MGMFDTVKVPCKECGAEEPFVSKSGACALAEYRLEDAPGDVLTGIDGYGDTWTCAACGRFNQIHKCIQVQVKIL